MASCQDGARTRRNMYAIASRSEASGGSRTASQQEVAPLLSMLLDWARCAAIKTWSPDEDPAIFALNAEACRTGEEQESICRVPDDGGDLPA